MNKPLFRVCVLGIIFGVSEGAVISHFAVFLSEDLNIEPGNCRPGAWHSPFWRNHWPDRLGLGLRQVIQR